MESNTVYEIREGVKNLISVCDSVKWCKSKIDNLKCKLDILDEYYDTKEQPVDRDKLESCAIKNSTSVQNIIRKARRWDAHM